MEVIIGKLKKCGVIYNREATSFSKFLLLKSREAFRQNPPHRLSKTQYGMVEGDFALAISLYHGYELVHLHGLRSLYNFLDGVISGNKGHGRTRTELLKIPDFCDLMNMLQEKFGKGFSSSQSFTVGHPKLAKLDEVVLNHFKSIEDCNNGQTEVTTRIMIFSQYRDSVEEITNMLKQHEPRVKAMSFIGQSSAGKGMKGFTQKEQLKVMKKFREGRYNTLVATCVGEEGLDIGEVDLIICYDASKSPIRLVQRMGRTGRKRQGRIVMLISQGKEEQIYNQGVYSKKSIHKAILNSAKTLQFYQSNPRMIPEGLDPRCHKMFITVKLAYKPSKEIILDSQIAPKSAKSKTKHSKGDDGQMASKELAEMERLMKKAKPLPKSSKFLSLGEDMEDNLSTDTMSYNNWMPWQNALQSEHQICHSKRTKNFVELVKFIEIQGCVDENSYDDEMRLYLDPEDIDNHVAIDKNSMGAKPPRKRSILKTNSSVVSVIADTDENDFEGVKHSESDNSKCDPSWTSQSAKKPLQTILETYKKAIDKVTNSRNVLQTVPEVIFVDDDIEVQIPLISNKEKVNQNIVLSGKSEPGLTTPDIPMSPLSTDSEAFTIPEAPTSEELEVMVSLLADTPIFPEDMLTIVQVWENQYLFRKTSSVEGNPSDSSGDTPNCNNNGATEKKHLNHDNLLKSCDIHHLVREENYEKNPLKENPMKNSDGGILMDEGKSVNEDHRINSVISEIEVDIRTQPAINETSNVGNHSVHLSDVHTLPVSDNKEENKEFSNHEEINFSDSNSLLTSQPNFDLSFSEVLVEEKAHFKNEQKVSKEDRPILQKEETSTEQLNDKICERKAIVGNAFKKQTINYADLNSYFDYSFNESGLQDAVLTKDSLLEPPLDSISKLISTNNDQAPLSSENKPLKKLSPKDDEFTFTQAMAVVHDSEEVLQASESNSEGFCVLTSTSRVKEMPQSVVQNQRQGNQFCKTSVEESQANVESATKGDSSGGKFTKLQTKHERNTTSFSSSEEEEDTNALAQFDLGFELDDVIPPSPCVSQNLSQVTFSRCRSQNILKSRKSLASTLLSQESKPSDSQIHQNHQILEEEPCSHVMEDDDFQTELDCIKEDSDCIKEDSESRECSPKQCNSIDIKEKFEQSLSPILSGRKSIKSQKFSSISKEDPFLSQLNRKSLTPNTSPSICNFNPLLDNFSSDEEVMAVKRKRKAVILDSPSSPLTQKQILDDDFVTPLKPPATKQRNNDPVTDDDFITPVKPSVKKLVNLDSSCGKSVQKKKGHCKPGVSFVLPLDSSEDEYDDFEVDANAIAIKKSVIDKCRKGKDKNNVKKSSKSTKPRKFVAEYLEDEAEVSNEDEYSCDEEEGSDLDRYDDSFIGEATQLSQRTSDNMHAIYLNSIKSVPVNGRFKLSHHHYNMDVYSQAPPEEESQYLEDSFVVEEGEEEDSTVHYSADEVTVMDVSELSYVGRRTRRSKPMKRTGTVKEKTLDGGSKRRRIRVMEESSSDGEAANNSSFDNVNVAQGKRKIRQVLMSSSSEDEMVAQKTAEETTVNRENLTLLKESTMQVSSLLGDKNSRTNMCRSSLSTLKTSPSAANTNRKDMTKEEQQRLERLQKQKEKQEEFRRILAEKKAAETRKQESDGKYLPRRSIVSSTGLIFNSSSFAVNTKEKHVVLVDSREINGCQEIISELRFQHGITVKTAQLANCDYIVSNRMGVDRQHWSEFTKGSRKDKLLERVTALCDLFDKPALIIEKDSTKTDDKNSVKPLHWTKYVEKTLVHLVRSKLTIYFTDHQKDTARVLSDICRLEARKNAGIGCPTDLDETSQTKLRFYTSIPGMSYITALNLCHNYKSISGFIVSDTNQIMAKGCLSKEQASRIKDYLERKFDPQMLPSGR
ncbi:Fanconi anemia group M protein-like isoform X2 [Ostrea edulis]|nr:Fanconi anemia group M protein-like isoform X2 [Ostrea edulis]